MDIIPWEKSEHPGFYISTWGRYGHAKRTYPRIVEYLDDNPKQNWRKGDLIKFDNGLKMVLGNTWQSWFMVEEDYLKTIPRHKQSPKYADNQYAVICGRYRIVKNKDGYIFYDYGIVIMMISGSKKGHIRKYWQREPWDLVSKFPYDHNPPLISMELIDSFIEHHEDSNESRNKFLECLYKKLNSV